MSYVWLPPVLVLSGIAVLLLIAIRRLPQVAVLAGDDLKLAEAKRAQRKLNPSSMKRVFLGLGRIFKMLGSSISAFFGSIGSKLSSASGSITSKRRQRTSDTTARVVSRKHRTKREAVVATTVDEVSNVEASAASVDASADVLSKEELLAKEVEEKLKLERAAAQLAAQKQQHELVMELSRMEKDARKALLVNDLVTAESLYAAIARKDANRVEVYEGLAEVYEKQGQHIKAQAALKRVLELDRHNTTAQKKLEQLVRVPSA